MATTCSLALAITESTVGPPLWNLTDAQAPSCANICCAAVFSSVRRFHGTTAVGSFLCAQHEARVSWNRPIVEPSKTPIRFSILCTHLDDRYPRAWPRKSSVPAGFTSTTAVEALIWRGISDRPAPAPAHGANLSQHGSRRFLGATPTIRCTATKYSALGISIGR